MRTRYLAIGLAVVAVAALGGVWWWQSRSAAQAAGTGLEATGMIEARQVGLAPEIGGRVVEVLVEEGDRVGAGQALLRLDDSLLLNQRTQAEAALRAAQANLDLLNEGATEEQLRAADSQLAQAEANLRLAQAALDGLTAGTRPEDLAAARATLDRARARYEGWTASLASGQIDAARSALSAAETNASQAMARREDLAEDSHNPASVLAAADDAIADAQAALDAVRSLDAALNGAASPYIDQTRLARVSWELALANLSRAIARHTGLQDDVRATAAGLEAAKSTHDDAQALADLTGEAYESLTGGASAGQLDAAWAEVQRAQAQLASLGLGGGGDPSGGAPTVETLLAQVDAAAALREAAAANRASLKKGARTGQVEAAQAQVDAARAQLEALNIQLSKLTLTAPWDGIVLTRSVEPGQTALPGGTLLEIGQLERLEITAYLPEEHFGRVLLGQTVSVRVDAYPDRTFGGTVRRLADEAEFTPTNVQTKEDRTRLVYAAVIGVDNPDLALKPGMIVDVVFGE